MSIGAALQVEDVLDVPDELYSHLWLVAKRVAKAMDDAFNPRKVCMVVEGFEVPHVHIKLYPIPEGGHLSTIPGNIADDEDLEENAKKIRANF